VHPLYGYGHEHSEDFRNCDDPGFEIVFTHANEPEKRPIMAARMIKATTEQQSNEPVKVKVIDRWRVVHPVDGTSHVKGDTLTVPQHVAEEWERCHWVERVTAKG
jgi:hypothetical protein